MILEQISKKAGCASNTTEESDASVNTDHLKNFTMFYFQTGTCLELLTALFRLCAQYGRKLPATQ
jgi:hypothetical protein